MTEKEKMLAGELYDCGDAELLALWHRAKDLARDYNLTNSSDTKRKSELLNELLGKVGNQLWITPPFHVVLIAPNVQIYTAYHPTHYLDRFTISENETFNFCKTQTAPVIIGKNVWIGGGTIILPGVTIGDNTVIGAGSVVTKDIPADTIAYGNPCKVHKANERSKSI